jgi:NADH-ubiquinone oxidoreductase chain 2
MIFTSILTLIVAKALPSLSTQLSSVHFTRITSIVFIFAGLLSLNTLYVESIGSGIGIYSGLFHVTQISQIFEIFIFFIGAFILVGWPLYKPLVKSNPINILCPNASKCKHKKCVPIPNFFNNAKNKGSVLLEDEKILPSIVKPSAFAKANGGSKYSTDYSLIVLFSVLGSSLLISSFDLISVYLSIELQSFGLYVLATLYRDSESSTSSGLKYFLLGGLSSCLILLGIGIVYSYTGVTNFESLYLINSALPNGNYLASLSVGSTQECISLGLILIFVGFLFKIAAAPLHNWSPDVYDGTPTIVTSWLTIIPKISILILLLEIQTHHALGIIGGFKSIILSNTGYLLLEGTDINNYLGIPTGLSFLPLIKTLLLVSSVLSLIVGSLLGLAQIRIKRLLAYSTISHIGFLLLALAINTEQSIDSFLFYMVQYTLTNLNIFLIILAITYLTSNKLSMANPWANQLNEQVTDNKNMGGVNEKPSVRVTNNPRGKGIIDIRYISEFKGLFFSNPLLSLSFAVCLFSMAGIPPLIGFFSKQFVLYSALANGYYFISILAIIVSVISASYYIKIVRLLTSPTSNNANVKTLDLRDKNKFTSSNNKNLRGLLNIKNMFTPAKAGLSSPKASNTNSNTNTNTNTNTNKIIVNSFVSHLDSLNENKKELESSLTNVHSFTISTLTLTILLFFLKPSIILNSTQLLSLSLFYI